MTLPATAAFPLGSLVSVTINNILSMGCQQTQGAKASSVTSL